jgi:hypothetical protein
MKRRSGNGWPRWGKNRFIVAGCHNGQDRFWGLGIIIVSGTVLTVIAIVNKLKIFSVSYGIIFSILAIEIAPGD